MYKSSIILFLKFSIIWALSEVTTSNAEENPSLMDKRTPIETKSPIKTDALEEAKTPRFLRNSSLVTKTMAENELAEISSGEVLPMVLFPIFDNEKQVKVLHFPHTMGTAVTVDKRLVKGTEFIIRIVEKQNPQTTDGAEEKEEKAGIKAEEMEKNEEAENLAKEEESEDEKTDEEIKSLPKEGEKEIKKPVEMFFCPRKNSADKCLAPQTFKDSEKLQCETEATPVMRRLDQGNTACGPGGIGIFHKVVYNICPNDLNYQSLQYETREVKFYEFCYNSKTKRILYTSHYIISPELLFSNILYRDRTATFKMIKDNLTPSRYENSENPSKEETPDLSNQPKIKKKSAYKLQKLVPPEDMAFGLWVKTTFEYINTEYQHKKLISLWNKINGYVRETAIVMFFSEQIIFHVKTAVIDTTFAESAPEDDQFSNLWVKMIYTTQSNSTGAKPLAGIAIFINNFVIPTKSSTTKNPDGENLTENDLDDDTLDDFTIDDLSKENESENNPAENSSIPGNLTRENELEKYCEENLCRGFDKIFKKKGSRARCCHITRDIVNLFGISEFTDDLPLEPLHITGIW